MKQARAVVAANVTPMRAEAGRGEVVSQAIFGETVVPLREEGDYSEIRTPDGYTGWALSSHLTVLETDERYPDPTRAAMVTPLLLPVYREPTPRAERLTLLTLGTTVELARDGDAQAAYYPIRMPAGGVGYVDSSALIVPTYPPLEELGPNLVVVARGLIGVPYLWGGRTPFGIDCSGFVQRVYWLCGHTLPRDAYQQAASERLTPVDREALQPGDLVFFCGEDPRGRGITHVGLATGDGRFLHASTRYAGVAITPLDEPPYAREYRCARRLE